MENLSEQLNFSDTKGNESAIKINKWGSVNHYETLCLYLADNDIEWDHYSQEDFDACAEIMADFGQNDKSTDHYYFWIA